MLTTPFSLASVLPVDGSVLYALPTLRCCCLRSRSRLSFVRCRGISLFSVRKYLFCRHAIVFNTRVSSLSCFSGRRHGKSFSCARRYVRSAAQFLLSMASQTPQWRVSFQVAYTRIQKRTILESTGESSCLSVVCRRVGVIGPSNPALLLFSFDFLAI